MAEESSSEEVKAAPRSVVVRDVVVFQFKLFVDGLRDFALVPVSLIAALVDVLDRGHRPGYHFYRVVRFGRETERYIHLFEAAERVDVHEGERFGLEGRKLDDLISEIEGRVKEEYEADALKDERVRARLERLLARLRGAGGSDR